MSSESKQPSESIRIDQDAGAGAEGKPSPAAQVDPAVNPQSRSTAAVAPHDTQPADSVPTAGLRKKRRTLWPTLVIVAMVGIVGFLTFYDRMRPHERITVTFEDLHGLHVGSPLEHRGDQIGEIVEIERSSDLTRRKVVVELIDDAQIRDRLRRNGNEFFVSRFASDRMQLKGVTKVIRGPSIVVRLGSAEGDFRKQFDGSDAMPPDPRVSWNSVRATVTFANVQGLAEGAFVMDRGQEIGVVEKVLRENDSDLLKVSIAFFCTEADGCPYVREGTRYFVNKAKLTTKGVEGDASTLLYGAHVVAIPDPAITSGKPVLRFAGDSDAPPEHLPRTGEKQLVLESASWLPPDTPIFYRGDLAGYVLRVQQASDSNSFYVVVRIYPAAVPQVCEKTVFFMQAKMKAQLFKSHGLFSWEGPRVEIPDPQLLLRPAIEFRTPPNSGKKAAFEAGMKPAYTLYPEPKEEWMKWTSSIPIEEPAGQPRAQVSFPQAVQAKFHWRESWKPLISWHKHEGLVLPVQSGVIGPVAVLKPTVAEAGVVKPTFEVGGVAIARKAPSYLDLGPGVCFMPLELSQKVQRCPSGQFASVSQPVDCWVVTNPDQPKAIAAAKLTGSGNQWTVNPDAGFQSDWHGAPVLCRDRSNAAFGKVIGVFIIGKDAKTATVSLFPEGVERMV